MKFAQYPKRIPFSLYTSFEDLQIVFFAARKIVEMDDSSRRLTALSWTREKIEREGETSKKMKLLWRYVKRQAALFFSAIVFLAVEAAADLFQPAAMARIVDSGIAKNDVGAVWRYGAVMLAVALAGAGAAAARNWLSSLTSQKIAAEMRADVFRAALSLPLASKEALRPESLITRVTNDVAQAQEFISGCMRVLVKAPLTCLGAAAIIALNSPRLIPLVVCVACASLAITVMHVRASRGRFEVMQRAMDGLNGALRTFLSSVRTSRAYGTEEREAARFGRAAGELRDASVRAMRLMALFMPLVNLTANCGVVALLCLFRAGRGGEVGSLMASLNYMTQILFALTMFGGIFNRAARAQASAERIAEALDAPRLPADEAGETVRGGEVEFDHVSFAWPDAPGRALEDVSFHLREGESLGVIGPTGSGKSTLAQLLPRLYDAPAGVVRVGGVDVTRASSASLRRAVAFVPQRCLLFSGTIRENLLWGDENASEADLREALRASRALDFVDALPDGLDAQLGQGGVNLSGGQKQRLTIARALLRQPRVLVLDDATSALDGETEACLLEKLLARKTSLLLVSSRVGTVRRCARVLYLEGGRVCGLGTHDELLRACSGYRELYRSQIGGDFDD